MPIPNGFTSVKVKYDRDASPTVDNPLNGLLDYTQVGKGMSADLVSGVNMVSFKANTRTRLLEDLKRQNIRNGKFKQIFKPVTEVSAKPDFQLQAADDTTTCRIRGITDDVLIKHGHFLDHQKNSPTGNSTEPLNWVVKLDSKTDQKFFAALKELNTPSFRAKVDERVRGRLEKGDAIEFVNDDVKSLINQLLATHKVGNYKGKFTVRRAGSLKDATVVIGEHCTFENNLQQTDHSNGPSKSDSANVKPVQHYERFAL
jgi:hypothetical protein